jgi:hypothetical protein
MLVSVRVELSRAVPMAVRMNEIGPLQQFPIRENLIRPPLSRQLALIQNEAPAEGPCAMRRFPHTRPFPWPSAAHPVYVR